MGARRTVSSGRDYLYRLGRYLLLYFPEGQAVDILTDYQDYFLQEALPPEESLRRWGTPEQALSSLLAENPGARRYGRRHLALWGAFLLLVLMGAGLSGNGPLFALLLLPPGLLGITRAFALGRLERRLPPPPPVGRGVYLAHALAAAAAVLLEAGMQWLLRLAPALPAAAGGIPAGRLLSAGCLMLAILAGLLLFWMLWRMLADSVCYLAGACHALGVCAAALSMRGMLYRLASLETARMAALGVLGYYGTGLLLALLCWGWMKAGRRG